MKITTSGIPKILYLKIFLFFLLVDFFGFLLRGHKIASFGPGALYNILILFLILIYILSERRTVFNKKMLPLFIFFSYLIFSAMWSYDIIYSLRDLAKYAIIPLSILMYSNFSKSAIEKAIFFVIDFLNIIAIINLCFLFLALSQIGIANYLSSVESYRFTDSIVFFGIYLLHLMLLFLYRSKFRYHFLFINTAIVAISLTRAYILAFVISYILFLFTKKVSFKFLFIGIGGVLLSLALIFNTNNSIKRRFFWNPADITFTKVIKKPSVLINDNVVISSGRFRAWKYLVESAFKTNSAILGAGVGSSRPLLRQYVKYQSMQVAHGDYAKYLAEAGYAGLSLYLLFFLYYILYSFRQSYEWQSKNKYISRLYFMVFCGFIYFLITSMAYEQFNKVGFVSFLMLLLIFAEKNKEEFNVSKKI